MLRWQVDVHIEGVVDHLACEGLQHRLLRQDLATGGANRRWR